MISRLIITTKDRPELVQRTVDSFRPTGLPITVYDQSEIRPSYTGIERLVGPPEVAAMIDRLTPSFDRELLQWALVGGHGGYRNVALLDTIGERVMSTDDDTLCEFVGSPHMEEGFHYGHPEPYWRLFGSRGEWQQWSANLPHTTDVVGEHNKYVGQKTQDGFTFCVVAAGLIGDSASSFNGNLLADGECFDRLISDYENLKNTREVMQIVPQATMWPGSKFLRTMNYSFDNTVALPPFPPNGRGECAVFATVLSLVEKTVVAYLPWGVVHTPPTGRGYLPMFGPLSFDEVFYWVQGMAEVETVSHLGKALAAFRDLDGEVVHELFQQGRENYNARLRDRVQTLLKQQEGNPQWRADCEELIAQSEAPTQFTLEDSIEHQSELARYGDLLQIWPSLREALGRE